MARKHYLLVSDFDQTLSFNDSGHVMSDMLGITDFGERVAGFVTERRKTRGAFDTQLDMNRALTCLSCLLILRSSTTLFSHVSASIAT